MDDYQFRIFKYSLWALCYISTLWAVLSALGFSTETSLLTVVLGGLLGLMKVPSQKSVTVDNKASDPIPVEDAKDGI